MSLTFIIDYFLLLKKKYNKRKKTTHVTIHWCMSVYLPTSRPLPLYPAYRLCCAQNQCIILGYFCWWGIEIIKIFVLPVMVFFAS